MKWNDDYRLPLAIFVWVEAWLTVPWLASELSLPGPLSHHYVWNKIWAALVLPAIISMAALAWELGRQPRSWGQGVLLLGLALDTVYLVHQLPPPLRLPLEERWTAAAASLLSVTWATKRAQENAAPGLGLLAAATLLSAFAAQARLALALAAAALFATWVASRRKSSASPPST